MVKLYAINILYKGPNAGRWLKSAYELGTFSYFQRGSVQEFMAFVSKTMVERTMSCARQSVKEGGEPNQSLNKTLSLFLSYFKNVFNHYSITSCSIVSLVPKGNNCK